MLGIVGAVKWYGTHRFLFIICVLDLCFIAYDLSMRNQELSAVAKDLLRKTEKSRKETEILLQENLNFFRKHIIEKQQEKMRIRELTEQMENIEALLEDLTKPNMPLNVKDG